MHFARPRFTMRWLLVGFAVLTVAFYFLFVRPTHVASRFVRAVNEGAVKRATSMIEHGDKTWITSGYADTTIATELLPREWSDVWHFRRRIVVSTYVNQKSRNQRTGKEFFKTIAHQTCLFEAGLFRIRMTNVERWNYF